MSAILSEHVGQRCIIKNEEEEYLTGHADVTCHVLAMDDEWIKIAYVDEAGNRVSKLERVDTIDSVLIVGENR